MRIRRTSWVRSVVIHNTKNIETKLLPGTGPSTGLGKRVAEIWKDDPKHAGAHLCIDWDATVSCHADLLRHAAYHAGTINEVSIGIELYEDGHGQIYASQLDAMGYVVEWLCERFGIQKQMNIPTREPIQRIVRGGHDAIGVFGHCHNTGAKRYDPGMHVWAELMKRGFKAFDFGALEDRTYWSRAQKIMGILADGIPGPITCDALRDRGFHGGCYDFTIPLEES
jgi:hypothetical protein